MLESTLILSGHGSGGPCFGSVGCTGDMIRIGLRYFSFAAVLPLAEGFYKTSGTGSTTLPQLMGMNHYFTVELLCMLEGAMFCAMRRCERVSSPRKVLHGCSCPSDVAVHSIIDSRYWPD